MKTAPHPTDRPATATARLQGRITDAESGALLPCWVWLEQGDGAVVDDWRVRDHWRGFPCDGTFDVACAPGAVRLRIRRPLSHQEHAETLTLQAGDSLERAWALPRWVDLERLHFVGGESHDHLNYPIRPPQTVQYCRAMGLRYLNACQGWMHRPEHDGPLTGDDIARRFAEASTPDFSLHFGAERPKSRYGHVWWLNLKPFADPYGEYTSWHDPDYVDFVEAHPQLSDNVQRDCPLPTELPFQTWRRYRRDGGAFVAAHPTSWWLLRPTDEQIITNITSELPFMLLSGEAPDALAVMGYDPDQVFYQYVWFHLLNEGYLLAGFGETDGDFSGPHHIGQIVSYTQLDPRAAYTPAHLVEAMRNGRSVMSSGPFVRFEADGGRHRMGDRIAADGTPHTLDIEAWSAADPQESLSWVVVYRNGRPFHIRDLRTEQPRHVKFSLPVRESGPHAWYLVKAYGRLGPAEAAWLDVMSYVDLCLRETHTEYRAIRQVALTNPIWFVGAGWQPPAPVLGELNLRVVDESGRAVPQAAVHILDGERSLHRGVTDDLGRLHGRVPPTAELEISAPGRATVRKSIFLDYRPVNECLESCYCGRWRKEFPHLQPGQVPWSAFRFHDLKRALSHIDWTITLPAR